jgi:hypothetical protein
MDQQTIILASIGDLEVTRRTLILEIQARDEVIADLKQRLAVYEPEEDPAAGNGQVSLLDEVEVP